MVTGLPPPGVLLLGETVPERDNVQPQGAQRTGFSSQARRRLYAVVACLFASAIGDSAAQSKPAGPIQYEQAVRSSIVYFEESGGMMARQPAPATATVEEVAPRKTARREAEAPKDRATPTTPATSASARRTAPRGDAVAAKQ